MGGPYSLIINHLSTRTICRKDPVAFPSADSITFHSILINRCQLIEQLRTSFDPECWKNSRRIWSSLDHLHPQFFVFFLSIFPPFFKFFVQIWKESSLTREASARYENHSIFTEDGQLWANTSRHSQNQPPSSLSRCLFSPFSLNQPVWLALSDTFECVCVGACWPHQCCVIIFIEFRVFFIFFSLNIVGKEKRRDRVDLALPT